MNQFEKLSISLRYFLLGAKYYNALKAWDFAEPLHSGFRKDLVTREFQHQIEIVHFLRTLPALPDPESIFTIGFLHDTPEDKDIPFVEIADKFGEDIAKHIRTLSKVHRGVSVPSDIYYDQIGQSPYTALPKGADRLHNVGSMVGVFTKPKLISYVQETDDLVIPMLKRARRAFPEYEASFENIKQNLNQQLKLITAIISMPDAQARTTENIFVTNNL